MIKISKKQVGFAILTVLSIVCFILFWRTGRGLLSEQGAERFSGDGERYAQISTYFTEDDAVSEWNIGSYRSSVQKELEEASIESPYKDARLWLDCYSAKTEAKLVNESATVDATMIGVGGDFFYFHPLTLQKGYYFSEKDVNQDRILVDGEIAWKLFGSYDAVGRIIQINGRNCKIAGVFELPEDKVTKEAVGQKPLLYVPFELLAGSGGATPPAAGGSSGSGPTIDCYQILLPDPVSGFARKMVLKAVAGIDLTSTGGSEKDVEALRMDIVQNTDRFSFVRLLTVMKESVNRSMHNKPMEYPFWENIARAKEDKAITYLELTIIFVLLPLIVVLYGAWRRFHHRKWTLKRVRLILAERVEERKKKKWEEMRHEKEKSNH